MPVITDDILIALRDAKHDHGSVNNLAEQAGINTSIVQKWLSGKTHSISEDNYERIFAFIRAYLPDEPRYWPRNYTSIRVADMEGKYTDGEKIGNVPILPMVDTAGIIKQFLSENVPIPEENLISRIPAFDSQVCIGFRMSASTMAPTVQAEDIILCERIGSVGRLPEKCVVVVKFTGCPPECKELRRFEELTTLQTPSAGKGDILKENEIEWILRVRYMVRRM